MSHLLFRHFLEYKEYKVLPSVPQVCICLHCDAECSSSILGKLATSLMANDATSVSDQCKIVTVSDVAHNSGLIRLLFVNLDSYSNLVLLEYLTYALVSAVSVVNCVLEQTRMCRLLGQRQWY